MSNIEFHNSINNDNQNYFSYFNHILYDNTPIPAQNEESPKSKDFQKLNITPKEAYSVDNEEANLIPLNLLELSPKAKSNQKLDLKSPQIKPELQKYMLPKSLFNFGKSQNLTKENLPENNNNSIIISQNKKNDSSNGLVKKLNLSSEPFFPKIQIVPMILINNPSYLVNFNKEIKKNKFDKTKKKNKKNKEFVEREGDWSCYLCKNINFAFRKKCNKCQMSKEESEKKFIQVGEELKKLADLSVYKGS